MSYLLRHDGPKHGLAFDDEGYTATDALMALLQKQNAKFTIEDLIKITQQDKKTRFHLTDDLKKIRANQGHSELVAEFIDPEKLCTIITNPDDIKMCIHGTYQKYQQSILDNGLKVMSRQFIHCAEGFKHEVKSGYRENCNLLVVIDAKKAMEDGMKFYRSANGVILTAGFDGVVDKKYFKELKQL